MPQCWGAVLGGCSATQSREHVVSAGLWSGPAIDVVGFPWCKDEPKRVGVASLTAKILCTEHNSRLSPVDSAAIEAFGTLRASAILFDERESFPERRWPIRRFEINGAMLERWFLKTMINVYFSTPGAFGFAGAEADNGAPSRHLVAAAFGREQLVRPMGLYTAMSVGEEAGFIETIRFAPLLLDDHAIGGIFDFSKFRFILNITPNPLRLLTVHGLPRIQLLYHPKKIHIKLAGTPSHYIHLLWPKKSAASG
jgi:hypothetical protein